MDRIYINHQHDRRRIHIEIDEAEIADLLDDIGVPDFDAFAATHDLVDILKAARDAFGADRQRDAHGAEISRT